MRCSRRDASCQAKQVKYVAIPGFILELVLILSELGSEAYLAFGSRIYDLGIFP